MAKKVYMYYLEKNKIDSLFFVFFFFFNLISYVFDNFTSKFY